MSYTNKKCFVLDLDGTVYLGDIPITGTIDFINNHWDSIDFFFLSNNTSKSPQTYLTRLAGLGIPATEKHLLSPTTPLVRYLREHELHNIYLVGNNDYRATLHAAMPELTLAPEGAKQAQAVILAYDTELTYTKLVTAGHLLQQAEVHYFATHPDLVCPHHEGPLPDVGSFIALFEKATNRVPERIFGKPEPAVLEPLFDTYSKDTVVMVGDRLSTDKKLAENAGIDFVLVLSGEATREDLKGERIQPWQTVQDLSELQ